MFVKLRLVVEKLYTTSAGMRFDGLGKDQKTTITLRSPRQEDGVQGLSYHTVCEARTEVEPYPNAAPTFEALWEGRIPPGVPAYEALGKRIVRLIRPPVNKLINLLRANYGQYWLREIEEWDSRSRSLGSFCAGLGVRWSLDGGKTWSNFVPTERFAESYGFTTLPSDEDFRQELLTEDDWRELPLSRESSRLLELIRFPRRSAGCRDSQRSLSSESISASLR